MITTSLHLALHIVKASSLLLWGQAVISMSNCASAADAKRFHQLLHGLDAPNSASNANVVHAAVQALQLFMTCNSCTAVHKPSQADVGIKAASGLLVQAAADALGKANKNWPHTLHSPNAQACTCQPSAVKKNPQQSAVHIYGANNS